VLPESPMYGLFGIQGWCNLDADVIKRRLWGSEPFSARTERERAVCPRHGRRSKDCVRR
jgi:hypothetical protein